VRCRKPYPPQNLAGRESRSQIKEATACASPPTPVPYASIGIQYSGAPGSVIAEVASIEQNGVRVVGSNAVNAGNNFAGSGAHAWHLNAQTESILYLSNLGNQECPIGLRVQANGVTYHVTDLRLKAHETRAISLRQLRDAQKPDFKGHKIPAAATDGSVLWARLKNLPVTGTLDVVTNGELVTPEQSGSCCCPANYQGLSLTPQSPILEPGATLQFAATLSTMDCNGVYYYSNWTSLVTWSSSATNIATVNAPTGLLTAKNSSGTTNIVATGSCWEQYMCCTGVCNPCACVPVEGGTTASVGDSTPVILSVSPNVWDGGATTTVTLGGEYFGTNTPGLSVTGIMLDGQPAIISHSDTQIVFSVTVDANDPGNTASIVVTSTGYNGNGFAPPPGRPGRTSVFCPGPSEGSRPEKCQSLCSRRGTGRATLPHRDHHMAIEHRIHQRPVELQGPRICHISEWPK
jgi:hypothetical protein